ncbi:15506_t:CDS:2, partial [Racocetra fulgida]
MIQLLEPFKALIRRFTENDDDSSSTSDDNDIPAAKNQQHLKHAYQQFKQQIKNTRRR